MSGCKCKNFLTPEDPSFTLCTGDITCYDGGTLACLSLPVNPTLNDIIASINTAICDINATIAALPVPCIVTSCFTFDGVCVAPCLPNQTGEPLNDVICLILANICALQTAIVELPTTAMKLTQPADPSFNDAVLYNTVVDAADLREALVAIDYAANFLNGSKMSITAATVLFNAVASSFIISGAGLTTSPVSLSVTIAAASVFDDGENKSIAGTVILVIPTRDNYIFYDIAAEGYITIDVAQFAPAPATPPNHLIVGMCRTDGVGVTSAFDLRDLYSIGTSNIKDLAVTAAKIADATITSSKMTATGVVAGSYIFSDVVIDQSGRVTSASSPVTLVGLVDNDVLQYNAGLMKWENKPIVGNILPSGGVGNVLTFDGVNWTAMAMSTAFVPITGTVAPVSGDIEVANGVRIFNGVTNEILFTGGTNITINGTLFQVSSTSSLFDNNMVVTAKLTTDEFNLAAPTVPVNAGDPGAAGDIAWDASFIYVCIAANSWKRAAIVVW